MKLPIDALLPQIGASGNLVIEAPPGAGKTTITHLVPRLYDPVRGAVRIGGHDVRDLTLESLRSVVGMDDQPPRMGLGQPRAGGGSEASAGGSPGR